MTEFEKVCLEQLKELNTNLKLIASSIDEVTQAVYAIDYLEDEEWSDNE